MIKSQEHRKEKIVNFSTMCNDLINTFEQLNKLKPKKIVVFRDGVNEGQFDMVLNEELLDLKQTISNDHYQPAITLVVAQKRHHIRLFLEGASANVPLGTVVDTKIVHPFEFDFYLCSHYGSIGASLHTIFYADLVAYWAHMFQEVLMDSLLDVSYASKSSGNVSFTSSSYGSSFCHRVYGLRQDLQNFVFFI